MIAEIVGRNKAKPHCAASPLIGAHIGAIRLTPIAPYAGTSTC
jgi:hypothetical protein